MRLSSRVAAKGEGGKPGALVGHITAIQLLPRNRHPPMLTTHANPKAGRDKREDTLGQGIL